MIMETTEVATSGIDYQIHQSPKPMSANDDRSDMMTNNNGGIHSRQGLVLLDKEVTTSMPPGAAGAAGAENLTKLSLPHKKSSILGTSLNLINSIVGAGIIGIPYALWMSGLWAGVLLLILVAVLTDKSLRLLVKQALFHPRLCHLPVHTFEELASYPYGRVSSGFVLFNMFVMAYGAMVAYLLIIKDTVPTAFGYDHGTHMAERNLILVATSLVIILPLSMQRGIASLAFLSNFNDVYLQK